MSRSYRHSITSEIALSNPNSAHYARSLSAAKKMSRKLLRARHNTADLMDEDVSFHKMNRIPNGKLRSWCADLNEFRSLRFVDASDYRNVRK